MDNFRLLRTFLVVVNERSMVDAADILGCSPPAVSQQIARLEKDHGARLLERLPQGVRTTHVGEVLAKHARELLKAVENLDEAVQTAKDPSHGRLRITSFSSASAHLLPAAIGEFRKHHPSVKLSLVDNDWTRPYEGLMGGDADITLILEFDYVPRTVPHGIDLTLVGVEPFRIALPVDSPLAKKTSIHFRELRNEEFLSFTSRFPHTVTLRNAAAEAGFTPNITSEVNDYDVLPALVAAGLGCAIATPLMLAGASPGSIAVRKLVGPSIKRSVHIATRSGERIPFLDVMQANLRQALRDVVSAI